MIRSARTHIELADCLDESGVGETLRREGSALIKINLAHPPQPQHPRTDAGLLSCVIGYVLDHGSACAITESAEGSLEGNLHGIGLGGLLKEPRIRVLDLDTEEYDAVTVDNDVHYIPRCLRDYAVRIAVPVATKRAGMVFSNNVKLFVGAVPRKMYQIGAPDVTRPRIHLDLHKSIASVYRAVERYAPFHWFINGGNSYGEHLGEFTFDEILVGDDGVELDIHVLETIFHLERPKYVLRLETRKAPPGEMP